MTRQQQTYPEQRVVAHRCPTRCTRLNRGFQPRCRSVRWQHNLPRPGFFNALGRKIPSLQRGVRPQPARGRSCHEADCKSGDARGGAGRLHGGWHRGTCLALGLQAAWPAPRRRHRPDRGAGGPASRLRPRTVVARPAPPGHWIVSTSDHAGAPFFLVDKPQARMLVFDDQGRLQRAAAVLHGVALGGDSAPGIGTRQLADIRPEERTTPAGRFIAEQAATCATKAWSGCTTTPPYRCTAC